MTRDDVMRATIDHTLRVGELMVQATHDLNKRAVRHDRSKFDAEEFDSFANETPNLKNLTYGSPEYREALDRIRPAIDRHQKRNRHHPEFYPDGVKGMNLLDLIEMLADWKAAGERHADGDLRQQIWDNAERFGYSDDFRWLLMNTAAYLNWLLPETGKNA